MKAGNGFAPVPPEVDAQGVTAEEFLERLFEFEYCSECGKDKKDHVAVIDPFGNWHAYCQAQEHHPRCASNLDDPCDCENLRLGDAVVRAAQGGRHA